MTDTLKQQAEAHVGKLKRFYRHLWTFAAVMLVLIIINLVNNPHNLWFLWIALFWGIAIAIQAFSIWGPGKKMTQQWEDKKVQEYMDKNKEN